MSNLSAIYNERFCFVIHRNVYSILDDTTGAWDAAAGTTPLGALAGHFKMGFEVVAVMKTERGGGPLAGAWEVCLVITEP